MAISLNLQHKHPPSSQIYSKSTDLHGRSDPEPHHAPTPIQRGIDITSLDYLAPQTIVQGCSMDLYQNYGTVSCINSISEE